MTPLNLTQLQNEVLSHGFDATYKPRVTIWLNEACQRVARAVMTPELTKSATLTCTPGSNLLSAPSDIVRIVSLYDEDNKRQLMPETFVEVQAHGEQVSNPVVYALDESNNSLRLYPTPTAANSLTLTYYGTPKTLSAPTDEPDTPEAYQDLLITYALSKAFRAEDDFEASTVYRNQFVEDLARAQNDLQYRDITPRQVPGSWSR